MKAIPSAPSTREMRAEQRRAQFPKDSLVRIKPERLDGYKTSVAGKLKNRVGQVSGHQMFAYNPIVKFPPIGRRKEFSFVSTHALEDLEVVTDATAIAEWQAAITVATAKNEAQQQARKRVSKTPPGHSRQAS